jgi:GntR family transcriptional repressor for pyruvate dehydrogenase complex
LAVELSAPLTLEPVKRSRLSEDIVTQILQLMGEGHLTGGSRLPSERELSAQLGVSRPSVREALRRLELMGVIETRPGSGAFIREVTDDDLVQPLALLLRGRKHLLGDILETRKVIEPHIARLAAEKASAAEIEELERLVRRQEAKTNQGKLAIEEDSSFHHTLARASGNRVLLLLVESCMDLLRESRRLNLQSPERARRSLEGHFELLQAIKERNAEGAFQAMRRHLEGIEAAIRSREGSP